MEKRLLPKNNRKCSIEGCDNHGDIRKGLCNMHYRRWKRHGDPLGGSDFVTEKKAYVPAACDLAKCTISGCAGVAKARGYCSAHYGRFQKYGDPLGGGPARKPWSLQGGSPCCIEGCDRKSVTRGMCSAHYARWTRLGDAESIGPVIRRQNLGGKQIDKLGYVYWTDVTHPMATRNGRVYEHRVVISELIGRSLFKGENVHHKNGNRADNRPGNLELWVTMQPSGQRPADLIEFAKQILERYPESLIAALD